ncbi:hypothetical protein BT63DRAFT_429581 [Microthyrium microscopicum]|uniref:Nicotinamide N-methyltransferase n=1 Tax=Microthyrium microscopicum TaxID=703497 RepID=A0A6A6TX70_9PEZI|nr:hypothetical protein BT63DRAFT_429581 [Microthyrium microscopicum]
MLQTLLRTEPDDPSIVEPEDLFSSALSTLFPDDCTVQHGDTQSALVYASAYGSLRLRCADVNGETERTKFAHYLWNAGLLMGELVGGPGKEALEDRAELKDLKGGWWVDGEEESRWLTMDQSVLELGAGVGLAGIVSILAGARKVVSTDYPAPALIKTLELNVHKNTPSEIMGNVSVEPHLWGDITSKWAKSQAHSFTRILAADTLWLAGQHENLAQSMAHFLARESSARVFMVAGFHTGRAKVAHFFEIIDSVRLVIEDIYEMDVTGNRREWSTCRQDPVGSGKRWLVLAILRWKDGVI